MMDTKIMFVRVSPYLSLHIFSIIDCWWYIGVASKIVSVSLKERLISKSLNYCC